MKTCTTPAFLISHSPTMTFIEFKLLLGFKTSNSDRTNPFSNMTRHGCFLLIMASVKIYRLITLKFSNCQLCWRVYIVLKGLYFWFKLSVFFFRLEREKSICSLGLYAGILLCNSICIAAKLPWLNRIARFFSRFYFLNPINWAEMLAKCFWNFWGNVF